MKKAGIVDPTKVTRSALQNAASIASMVITTKSLVTDTPEKNHVTVATNMLWGLEWKECIKKNKKKFQKNS